MKKKFMSRPMKIFIIVLTTIFISTYIISAILLFNSNYSLSKYFNGFNISFDYDEFSFSSGKYHISDSTEYNLDDALTNIDISTSSIDVIIEPSDSDKIKVSISGKAKEHSSLNNLFNINNSNTSELSISQKEKLFWGGNLRLTLSIPSKYNKNLTINTTSGDISLSDLTLQTVNTNSTSGDVDIENITASESKVNLTSGDIDANGNLGNISMDSTSGDIDLELDKLGSSNNISTCSGDIYLSSSDTNYSLEYKTNSGDFDNGTSQDYTKSINTYNMSSGNGDNKINVSTTSGDFSFD